jgi:hypothetical protein
MGMDVDDVMSRLRRMAKLDQVHQVTTFKGYRPGTDGTRRVVTVEIWDAGPSAGRRRFQVVACDQDGRTARGDRRETIEAAIAATQWFKLDPEFTPDPPARRDRDVPGFNPQGIH